MSRYEDLNPMQKDCLSKLSEYMGTGLNRDISYIKSRKERECADRNNGRIVYGKVYDEEYRDEAMSAIGHSASQWARMSLVELSEEDKDDVDFRTEVMKRVSRKAGEKQANIKWDEEALKQAILYCPEGIKDWYNEEGMLYSKKDAVLLSPSLIEKIAIEAPEVIDRLPSDTISREAILKIVKLNPEKWLNSTGVQERLGTDSSLREELKPEIERLGLIKHATELTDEKAELDKKLEEQEQELELIGENDKNREE